ncbi:MAG: hypothetical protein ACW98Y_08610 [Candidatus Thorarchaeota archaeon]|jgi:hypothetical protein
MMEVSTVSRIQSVIEEVKSAVRRFIVPEIKYDEAARVHRCTIASEQAMKDLEQIKSGGKSGSSRHSYMR